MSHSSSSDQATNPNHRPAQSNARAHIHEIIKGSSSTLYGGGAIAGLINMVSKTPDEEPALDIMLTQTQALGSTANVFYSKRNEKFGISLYGSGHYQKAYDPEDDGFSRSEERV